MSREPGAFRRSLMFCSIGSKGETSGAARAVTSTSATTQRPKSAVRRRASRRRKSCHSRAAGRSASAQGDVAFGENGGAAHRRRMRGSR